jgi:adenylate kinase family enzyme
MLTKSILLLGPTGAGKSPLGDQIEKNGIKGKKCFHFDFGHELRSIAERDHPPEGFGERDFFFIRDVLEKGLLLDNEYFHIAEKIVRHFLLRNDFREDTVLVLNGLPRHVDQAQDMSGIVSVRSVIVLECTSEEVYRRINRNAGGDRTGRSDDSIDMISRKLEIFEARTAPLLGYYSDRGAAIVRLRITETSEPENSYEAFIAAFAGLSF